MRDQPPCVVLAVRRSHFFLAVAGFLRTVILVTLLESRTATHFDTGLTPFLVCLEIP